MRIPVIDDLKPNNKKLKQEETVIRPYKMTDGGSDTIHHPEDIGVQHLPVDSHAPHTTAKHSRSVYKDPMIEADERTGNLFDYVNWRGDIPMSVDPFNEVDNLLLSALVYAPFDGLVPEKGSITLYALNIAFWNKYTVNDFHSFNPALRYSPLLLKRISVSRRFGNIRACSFINEFGTEDPYQVAAVTFLLEDGTCYVAFRGTDDSVHGWREDMNLCYMAKTHGQQLAVDYLNDRFRDTVQFIRVGGHSKGGNLAEYAGMHCLPEVRERIREIYSNDGPGFNKMITNSEEYRRIVPKVIKFMPEGSIVGILLNSSAKAEVVKSTLSGVMQHSPYTWVIRRNVMVRANKRTDMSIFIDKTIDDWVNSLDPDNSRIFIDILFDAIDVSGCATIGEFTDDPVRAYKAFYKTMRVLPPDKRATLLLVLQKLAASGTNQILSGLTNYLSTLSRNTDV
ncbi:MAG: DUF2974 domain-containing protein [Eubacterium sp.]|nr:DUF2974 domain-containing protein [Eubacterium sp.]